MIAVTGSSGWVGSAVVRRLQSAGISAYCDHDSRGERRLELGDASAARRFIEEATKAGATAVIHCAARVHQPNAGDPAQLAAFLRVNSDGTARLASAAKQNGLRRFVFVSTIKVNGESTNGRPFTGDDMPAPMDAYGRSKLAAERHLASLVDAEFETTVLRPPLLYGGGVKANFRALVRVVLSGMPLPFGCVTENRRNIASVRNFADALVGCAIAPASAVAGRIFAFADHPPLATRELIERIAVAAGIRPRLIKIPVGFLSAVAHCMGKTDVISRLIGSLEVDGTVLRTCLNWTPLMSMEEELAAAVKEVLRSEEVKR